MNILEFFNSPRKGFQVETFLTFCCREQAVCNHSQGCPKSFKMISVIWQCISMDTITRQGVAQEEDMLLRGKIQNHKIASHKHEIARINMFQRGCYPFTVESRNASRCTQTALKPCTTTEDILSLRRKIQNHQPRKYERLSQSFT